MGVSCEALINFRKSFCYRHGKIINRNDDIKLLSIIPFYIKENHSFGKCPIGIRLPTDIDCKGRKVLKYNRNMFFPRWEKVFLKIY